jgi:hypothetical protein
VVEAGAVDKFHHQQQARFRIASEVEDRDDVRVLARELSRASLMNISANRGFSA